MMDTEVAFCPDVGCTVTPDRQGLQALLQRHGSHTTFNRAELLTLWKSCGTLWDPCPRLVLALPLTSPPFLQQAGRTMISW